MRTLAAIVAVIVGLVTATLSAADLAVARVAPPPVVTPGMSSGGAPSRGSFLEQRQVVYAHLYGAKQGGLGGGAVACATLSIDLYARLGFTRNGKPDPMSCLAAFYGGAVSKFSVGRAEQAGLLVQVYAVVDGQHLVFLLRREGARWTIRMITSIERNSK